MNKDVVIYRWADENGDLYRVGRNGSHYYTESIKPAWSTDAGKVTRTYRSKAEALGWDPDPYGELEFVDCG